ncbi:MAG: hypothetical protein IK145_07635 [Bacteroidales bacterium]|nr:hypothetical protein [Bacteroidales bacterium]
MVVRMGKRVEIVIGSIFFITLVSILLIVQHQPKKRPESVPSSAVWKGGRDGGLWYELVSIKGDTVRFRFYEDYGGLLVDDKAFIPDKGERLSLTSEDWAEFVGFFDGENVYLEQIVNNKYLKLVPVYSFYLPDEEP